MKKNSARRQSSVVISCIPILDAMKRNGLTKGQTAELLGVTPRRLNQLLEGTLPKNPSIEFQRRLLEFAGLLPEDLVPDEGVVAGVGAEWFVPLTEKVSQHLSSSATFADCCPHRALEIAELGHHLVTALNQLTPRQRRVLLSNLFYGKSFVEIGKELDLEPSRAYEIRQRARRAIWSSASGRRLRQFLNV